MRNKLFIAVNPVGSGFAKALQAGLSVKGIKALRVDNERGMQLWLNGRYVFFVTQKTLNKVEQFHAFNQAGVSCPKYTTTSDGAKELGVKTLFARTLISSTGGRGIVEFDTDTENYPRAPLYTEYIPKKAEYRIHVFEGKVIDRQQKKKKRGFEEDRNTRVSNLSNGYVYTRDAIVLPENIEALAVKAVEACRYSYGAVDIIYNEKRNQCYVLEVNSRPGLMGTTLGNYINAIKEYVI
jgi:predicted ATP-grasp superfamily ATP-dependent carboligase